MIGLVIDGLMEENDLAPPSSKKEIRSPPQYRRSLINLKFFQPLALRYKKKILVST